MSDECLFRVVDALDAVVVETGKTVPRIAINWVRNRPTVATAIIGAGTEDPLRQNVGAVGWELTPDQTARFDAASALIPSHPTWHQGLDVERNPPAV